MTDHNTLGDNGVIVYNEDGSVNRGSFGRVLSKLEVALCDALDKVNARYRSSLGILKIQRQPRTMGHG